MSEATDSTRRRWLWWAVAALAAIALVAALIAQSRGDDGSGSSSASGSSGTGAGTSTIPPSDIAVDPSASREVQTPEPQAPDDGAPGPELAPVPPAAKVATPSGVLISLGKLETLSADAVAPGEVAGPAIRATIVIENTTGAPLDLEYVVVNAYYGADRTPAGSATQPGGEPFTGSLDAAGTSAGIYLFTIPEQERGDVTITVDYKSGEASAVFRGEMS